MLRTFKRPRPACRVESIERRLHLDATLDDIATPPVDEELIVITLPYDGTADSAIPDGEILPEPPVDGSDDLIFWTTVIDEGEPLEGTELIDPAICYGVVDGVALPGEVETPLVDDTLVDPVVFDPEIVDEPVFDITITSEDTLIDPAVCFPVADWVEGETLMVATGALEPEAPGASPAEGAATDAPSNAPAEPAPGPKPLFSSRVIDQLDASTDVDDIFA